MDTATEVLAVAVGRGEEPLAGAAVRVPRGHSRLLQPTVLDLLRMCGLNPRDVELVAVGVGPGSYTGVRLAVSTAKAMATALGLPLVPVSTLRAVAGAACPGRPSASVRVLPLLFARRGRAFGALYEVSAAGWVCRIPPRVEAVEAWREHVHAAEGAESGGPLLLVHDFRPQDQGLISGFGEARRMTLAEVAGGIAPALLQVAARGEVAPVVGDAVHDVAPEYTLRAQAEVKWEEKDGMAGDGGRESGGPGGKPGE
ncbi:MAG: tRNA (adenosine(37)-N6)-threonylcarbamoyltransferase complex dimerization subunit type 1 TsaB [Thermoflavifilum sp.]|nr:tRNA (adenosine(37)-N6)-threonylcarbamoyltransferase complex dimerization subunit type 1 TsaB [Thermoflavifilum sp.]